MTLPETTVVVVNYGSHALLPAALEGLGGHDGERVVVVDNHTTAAETAAVESLAARHGWEVVALPTNTGFGNGVNAGVARAVELGTPLVCVLNPDAALTRENLDLLRSYVAEHPGTLAAPVIRRPDGGVWFDGADVDLRDGSIRATRKRRPGDEAHVREWVSGACFVIETDLFERAGGFDPDYFLYWEDVDFSQRVIGAGGMLAVVAEASAIHGEGGTQSTDDKPSPLFHYYNVRNRLLYARKHLDRATREQWIASAPKQAYLTLRRGGRAELLRPAVLWAGVRGLAAGLFRAAGRRDLVPPPPDRPIRVLESFPEPRETTNPYIWMLRDCLATRPDLHVDTFTWRRALTGHYDVFHAHWPEILVNGASPVKKVARQALFAAFLVRLRLNRTAVVRTRHNLELPQGISAVERELLGQFERQTTLVIALNDSTPEGRHPQVEIPHGHYKPWYDRFPHREAVPGRFGYFGLIRRYKAVDTLVRAFRELDDETTSLRVGGNPSSNELSGELVTLAAGDPRIELDLFYLSDEMLVQIGTESQVVVLPYKEMHNSGSVLAALSVGRPVLVPDNEVNRDLAREVGEEFVLRYDDALTAADLRAALAAASRTEGREPDLSARNWDVSARLHAEAFARAVELVRGARSPDDF